MEQFKSTEQSIEALFECVYKQSLKYAKEHGIPDAQIKHAIDQVKNKYSTDGFKVVTIPCTSGKAPRTTKNDIKWAAVEGTEYFYTTEMTDHNYGFICNKDYVVVAGIDKDGSNIPLTEKNNLFLSMKGYKIKRTF
jgi:hypothetical protein